MAFPHRVALVSDWFLPRLGGIEMHVADLAVALKRQGVDVSIFTTTPGPPSHDEVAIERLSGARAPRFGFSLSPRLANAVQRRLRDGGFGVVHAHASVVSPLALAAVLAARRLGLPTVVTFHSMLLKAVGLLRWSDRIWGWSRHPILYTAVSELVARQARAAVGDKDVAVLPNGVDLAAWPEQTRRAVPPGAPIVIATAMRLTRKKRPLPLLDAFQIARKIASAHEQDLELRIAGAGPDREALQKVIDRTALAGRVRLLGAQTRTALRSLYAQSDMFVMPSLRESFGLAALEARACGLPTIAMQGTGAEDFLTHGRTALLASDDRMLATYMAKLATDPAKRAALAGRDPGLERFGWTRVAAQHLDAYARAAELLKG